MDKKVYHVAEYQGSTTSFISEERGDIVNWIKEQEDPTDYQIHSFPEGEWNLWVK